MNLLNNM